MKKLLTIFCLVLLSSYSYSEEIPWYQLVERQGIEYKVNSTIPFTGSVFNVYSNGQLRFRTYYKDGLRHGLRVRYYRNGQLREKGNYKNGKPVGRHEWFEEDGTPFCWKNGKVVDMFYCED